MPESNNHKILRITSRPYIKATLKKYTSEKDFLHTYTFTETAYTVLGEFRGWQSVHADHAPTGFKRPSEIAHSSESNNFYLPIRYVTLHQVWDLQIFRQPRNTIPSFKSSHSPPNKKNTTQLTDRYDLYT